MSVSEIADFTFLTIDAKNNDGILCVNKKEKSNIIGRNDNRGTFFCGKLKGVKISIIFKRKRGILTASNLEKQRPKLIMVNNLRVTSTFLQQREKRRKYPNMY